MCVCGVCVLFVCGVCVFVALPAAGPLPFFITNACEETFFLRVKRPSKAWKETYNAKRPANACEETY